MANPRNPETYSSSTSVTAGAMKKYGIIVATGAGSTLTLPTPTGSMARRKTRFVNGSGGYISLFCSGRFVGTRNSFAIPPDCEVEVGVTKVSSVFYYTIKGVEMADNLQWETWTPTLSWTTATPTLSTAIYNYLVIDKTVFWNIYIATTDGAGATALTITPPIIPNDCDIEVPGVGSVTVDGTTTNLMPYVDCENNTVANRLIEFWNFQTWTDDKACSLRAFGFYPIGQWETNETADPATFTPDPGDVADDGEIQFIGDRVGLITEKWTTADSDAAAAWVCATPTLMQDQDAYGACAAIHGDGNTPSYTDVMGYLDIAHATPASRRFAEFGMGTATDGEALAFAMAGFYPVGAWDTWTPTLTWTTGTPPNLTTVGIYAVENGMCFFHFYTVSTDTDGNGASDLTINLPVPVLQGSADISCYGIQLQNATYTNPVAYIDADQQAAADRIIKFTNFSTCTASEACAFYVSGCYPVG